MSEPEDNDEKSEAKAKFVGMSIKRPWTGPDGKACFIAVTKIGECKFCDREFYVPGDEDWEKTHFQNDKPMIFQEGDIINIEVDMLKGPYNIGTAYTGSIKIIKVYPAEDFFACQHSYLIEILDKENERSLLDWWAMIAYNKDFEKKIEKESEMKFDDFCDLWDAKKIELPPNVKEEILTLTEWEICFWQKEPLAE